MMRPMPTAAALAPLSRPAADRLLDLALAARDEARAGVGDAAWLALVAEVYGMVEG